MGTMSVDEAESLLHFTRRLMQFLVTELQPMVLIGSGNAETGAAATIEVWQGVVIDEMDEVSELGK